MLYGIDSATLTAIANAIRAKTGGSQNLTPAQMAAVIEQQLRYPVGSMTVVADGTYDVSSCATIEVQTGASGGDLLSYYWNASTLTLSIVENEQAEDSGSTSEESGEEAP